MPADASFAPGTRLGAYEILGPLGAGGMGEVWRARDTRLNREVAIKTLPASFAADPDRLQRFAHEIRATSTLNHPNILTVYDTGHHQGAPFTVAELLDGEDLRAALANGALAPRQALDLARQIALGLAAAHERGIVHRDLKPENVFITGDGRVKILDFGLAKLRPRAHAEAATELASRRAITHPGTVMGTVGYMSPEQVRGEDVDHRSDLFSLGAILYEMLSGRRAFHSDSTPETMTAILKHDPPSLLETDTAMAPGVERIVRRCLEKKPERRFQTASDLGFALESTTPSSGSQNAMPRTPADERELRPVRRSRAAAIAAIVFGAALAASLPLAWAHWREAPAADVGRPIRLALPLPDHTSLGTMAVSPDGRWLAFAGVTGGRAQLFLRGLDGLTSQPIAGTDGAALPFWSPDSRWIGFFAAGKLRKVEVSGGPVTTLCEAGTSGGGTWNRDGVVLFTTLGFGIMRVSSAGGEAALLMAYDRSQLEWNYTAPSFLPDGQHFVFNISSARREVSGVYLGSLAGSLKRQLLNTQEAALLVTSARPEDASLIFAREGALIAQRFDLRQLALAGEPVAIADRVGRVANTFRANFSASSTGVLVYDPSPRRQVKQFAWLDRRGQRLPAPGFEGGWSGVWLSPDETRVAVDRAGDADVRDVWVHDIASGRTSRFTFDTADDVQPTWSPDGSRIAWGSNREGTFNLYEKAASGAGQDTMLLKTPLLKVPTDWSLDGRFIVFYLIDPKTRRDVWVLPLTGDRTPFAFAQGPGNETGGRISPDGRWLAYSSDETGAWEIYVESFPAGGGRQQVSAPGGVGPHWRRDGRELFYYASDGKLMAMAVKGSTEPGAGFEAGPPTPLFEFHSGSGLQTVAPYSASADGQRFLVNLLADESKGEPLVAIVNWAAALSR